ncbi:hypothetical protein ES332_A13G237000v1 [Gossypium tomentosum]|uniref:Protein kinase domain-containing protein n=1 Tax=Gossypium tomentosum TaxID=34277 RepID=A0A5D2MNU0_GOSTO|nr:hypothetical protein ES332_A13G237000v1 [Gossypium tomentosum]
MPVVDFVCVFLVSVVMFNLRVSTEPVEDKQALLAFISGIRHADRVKWNSSTSACDWFGVQCDANRSFVYTLRLPGAALIGSIPPNTIGRLNRLRVLSLRANRLSGEIPADFYNLTQLRSLYLQGNEFTGPFPPSVTRLTRLTRLDLSSNNFTGPIPLGVNNLTQLTGLFLQNNKFSGSLPSIDSDGLNDFNVSNNNLKGSIPDSLSKFPESSFAGNIGLCGGPLRPCNPFPPSPSPTEPIPPKTSGQSSKSLPTGAIIAIAVGSAIVALLLLLFLIICFRKWKRKSPRRQKAVPSTTHAVPVEEAGTSSSKDDITGGSTEIERMMNNKLMFFKGGVYSFDLEDLMRASAEMLGKGSTGTSYRVVLAVGTTVAVKRLKDVAVSKREFVMKMGMLGKIMHENVVPLRAFYYSDEEKLLVYDYMHGGSLFALLHGSRSSARTPLEWDPRMKIALGVARGLAHLHSSQNMVHGNIKSSNILLRPDHEACISEFGLNSLFNTNTPPSRIAGYQAPEVIQTHKVTVKSDVYSFGVLLLELLTGRAPIQPSITEEGFDLPRWVQSVVREEWAAEVLDAELMAYHDIEEEMVQALQIAMVCVSTVPDQRPVMSEVVRMIGDMIDRGGTNDGTAAAI